jgi:peptidoglycan/xylan/chitin deacetylase (PgdA/CDA1 family)
MTQVAKVAADGAASAAHPAVRPWTCLIYHDVSPGTPGLTGGRDYFSVSAETFARQLDIITALGFRGCSIAEAIRSPAGAVAISFDDGDLGQATRAFPALASRRMTATFFVTTSWMGKADYASWNQLREMKAAGMSIQSHTHTHPFLSELDRDQLRSELRTSREVLDGELGQRTTMLAYPGGDAPRRDLRAMLAEEGYEVVATSRWGRNSGLASGPAPRFIKRCTVRGALDEAFFTATVTANPWLSLRKQSRERILAFIRSSLGPTRYARWRRGLLNTAGSGT